MLNRIEVRLMSEFSFINETVYTLNIPDSKHTVNVVK